jgi:GTP cyclohydrolase II
MNKIKDSENLTSAIAALRRAEGIVLLRSNGERICLYPAEFIEKRSDMQEIISDNPAHINLAKRAGLLPLLAIIPENETTKNWASFAENALEQAMNSTPHLIETSRAKLPIEGAEDSKLVSFRVLGDDKVHLALVIGKPQNSPPITPKPPLVRVHSSCLTGDLLGSLRCDCGDQLKLALSAIKSEGYGILLYLNQEGREIGITNKIRSYNLQEQGSDTYAANHKLGFASDERDFRVVSQMLKALGIDKIRLLSNNPHKMAEIAKHGVEIVERVSLISPPHQHNQDYLTAKADAGHIF